MSTDLFANAHLLLDLMEQLDSSPEADNRDEIWGELYYHLAMTVSLVMPYITPDTPPLIPSTDGAKRIAVYTNEDDLRVNFPDALDDDRCIAVKFDQLIELLDKTPEATGIVVDLPSLGWIFDREAMAAIAEKRRELTDKHDERLSRQVDLFVADGKSYPYALAKALTKFADNDTRISKMWLRWIERAEVPGVLVVVESQGLDYDLLTDLTAVATPHVSPDERVHFVPNSSKLGTLATNILPPFYKRLDR